MAANDIHLITYAQDNIKVGPLADQAPNPPVNFVSRFFDTEGLPTEINDANSLTLADSEIVTVSAQDFYHQQNLNHGSKAKSRKLSVQNRRNTVATHAMRRTEAGRYQLLYLQTVAEAGFRNQYIYGTANISNPETVENELAWAINVTADEDEGFFGDDSTLLKLMTPIEDGGMGISPYSILTGRIVQQGVQVALQQALQVNMNRVSLVSIPAFGQYGTMPMRRKNKGINADGEVGVAWSWGASTIPGLRQATRIERDPQDDPNKPLQEIVRERLTHGNNWTYFADLIDFDAIQAFRRGDITRFEMIERGFRWHEVATYAEVYKEMAEGRPDMEKKLKFLRDTEGIFIPGEAYQNDRIPGDNPQSHPFIRNFMTLESLGDLSVTNDAIRLGKGADFDGDKDFIYLFRKFESGTNKGAIKIHESGDIGAEEYNLYLIAGIAHLTELSEEFYLGQADQMMKPYHNVAASQPVDDEREFIKGSPAEQIRNVDAFLRGEKTLGAVAKFNSAVMTLAHAGMSTRWTGPEGKEQPLRISIDDNPDNDLKVDVPPGVLGIGSDNPTQEELDAWYLRVMRFKTNVPAALVNVSVDDAKHLALRALHLNLDTIGMFQMIMMGNPEVSFGDDRTALEALVKEAVAFFETPPAQAFIKKMAERKSIRRASPQEVESSVPGAYPRAIELGLSSISMPDGLSIMEELFFEFGDRAWDVVNLYRMAQPLISIATFTDLINGAVKVKTPHEVRRIEANVERLAENKHKYWDTGQFAQLMGSNDPLFGAARVTLEGLRRSVRQDISNTAVFLNITNFDKVNYSEGRMGAMERLARNAILVNTLAEKVPDFAMPVTREALDDWLSVLQSTYPANDFIKALTVHNTLGRRLREAVTQTITTDVLGERQGTIETVTFKSETEAALTETIPVLVLGIDFRNQRELTPEQQFNMSAAADELSEKDQFELALYGALMWGTFQANEIGSFNAVVGSRVLHYFASREATMWYRWRDLPPGETTPDLYPFVTTKEINPAQVKTGRTGREEPLGQTGDLFKIKGQTGIYRVTNVEPVTQPTGTVVFASEFELVEDADLELSKEQFEGIAKLLGISLDPTTPNEPDSLVIARDRAHFPWKEDTNSSTARSVATPQGFNAEEKRLFEAQREFNRVQRPGVSRKEVERAVKELAKAEEVWSAKNEGPVPDMISRSTAPPPPTDAELQEQRDILGAEIQKIKNQLANHLKKPAATLKILEDAGTLDRMREAIDDLQRQLDEVGEAPPIPEEPTQAEPEVAPDTDATVTPGTVIPAELPPTLKRTVTMQPDNIEKILNREKTATVRTSDIGIPTGTSAIVRLTNNENGVHPARFVFTNLGAKTIKERVAELGSEQKVLESEGITDPSQFKFAHSRDWFDGKRKLFVLEVAPLDENNPPPPDAPSPKPNLPRTPDNKITEVHFEKGLNSELSNFDEAPFRFQDRMYRTAEGAYQSWRSGEYVDGFQALNGQPAKALGQEKGFRTSQEDALNLMREVLRAKFDQVPQFQKALRNSGKIEHSVSDNFWRREFPKLPRTNSGSSSPACPGPTRRGRRRGRRG
jgi:predicted NAD-dependent protein-ADP-ribosyltransferase YbiA (DUF1768 family)